MGKAKYGRELNIAGIRYARLTAVIRSHRENGQIYWFFKCDCGQLVVLKKTDVIYRRKMNCGCQRYQYELKRCTVCKVMVGKHRRCDNCCILIHTEEENYCDTRCKKELATKAKNKDF